MWFVITAATVICIFLAALVLLRKRNTVKHALLGIWLLITAAELGVLFIDYFHLNPHFPWLIGSRMIFPFLHAPLLFIYVRGQFDNPINQVATYVHGIPFLIVFSLWILFSLQPSSVKLNLWESSLTLAPSTNQLVASLILVVYVAIYLLASYKILIERKVHSLDPDTIWLKNSIKVYLIIWGLIVFIGLWINYFIPAYSRSISAVSLLCFSCFMIVLGFLGIRETSHFNARSLQTMTRRFPNERYQRSGLGREKSRKHAQKLKAYLAADKPYLNSSLCLGDLASYLGISENHLSQVINETIGCSFSELVNQYRIHEFKQRVAKKQFEYLTLMAIAQDCGFHSKSAFISSFKKATGLTPSQYKLQVSP